MGRELWHYSEEPFVSTQQPVSQTTTSTFTAVGIVEHVTIQGVFYTVHGCDRQAMWPMMREQYKPNGVHRLGNFCILTIREIGDQLIVEQIEIMPPNITEILARGRRRTVRRRVEVVVIEEIPDQVEVVIPGTTMTWWVRKDRLPTEEMLGSPLATPLELEIEVDVTSDEVRYLNALSDRPKKGDHQLPWTGRIVRVERSYLLIEPDNPGLQSRCRNGRLMARWDGWSTELADVLEGNHRDTMMGAQVEFKLGNQTTDRGPELIIVGCHFRQLRPSAVY